MSSSREREVATLGVGFAALLGAVLAAHAAPATSYEVSIYRATPEAYWIGLAVALASALVVALYGSGDPWVRRGAFLLAYAGLLSFVALPVFRGYHFLGAGDSLTHLGWVKDLAGGTLDPLGLLYPAVHLISLLTSSLLGVEFTYGIQVVVVLFFALFLLFVPLCVRAITSEPHAALVGLFSAGLLLPINNLGVFRMAFPFGQAVLFFPVVLYLTFAYLRSADGRSSPFGVALVLASVALVMVHPQLALGAVLAFAFLMGFQRWYRWRRPNHPVAADRPFGAIAVVVGAFYALWVGNKPTVRHAAEGLVDSLLAGVLIGQRAARQVDSAESVGMSFEEMAFKLFFASAVYAALAGGLMVLSLAGRLGGGSADRPAVADGGRDRDGFVAYLTVGSVPLFLLFGVFLAADIAGYHFRYLGAIMAVVTVLGAVALLKATRALARRASTGPARTLLVLAFAVLVPLSLMTVYFSPFILRGSGHVTEQRMNGYETAFEHREEGVGYAGIRTGPTREAHAVYGTERADEVAEFRRSDGIPPEVFDTNLSDHYEDDRYVPVRDSSYHVEVGLYDGFRYSERGFRSLDATPGIDRLQSNGEVRLYRVHNETAG